MSVLIKGMEMPTSCEDCPLGDSLHCQVLPSVPALWAEYTNAIREKRLHSDCTLVPVPPHGDLIEREAAYDKIAEQEGGNYVDMDAVDMGLSETPVIIPEDDAWPEWRTQVLGIRRQEEE